MISKGLLPVLINPVPAEVNFIKAVRSRTTDGSVTLAMYGNAIHNVCKHSDDDSLQRC